MGKNKSLKFLKCFLAIIFYKQLDLSSKSFPLIVSSHMNQLNSVLENKSKFGSLYI